MNRRVNLAVGLALLAALYCAADLPARQGEGSKDDLRKEIDDLKEDVRRLKDARRDDNRDVQRALGDIIERLKRIEARLGDGVSTRRAGAITPTPLPTGTIRLDNRLGVTALITIDGVMYTVPPLSTRLLRNRPTGSLVYEVTADGYGIRPPVRTPLAANETLTLTIY